MFTRARCATSSCAAKWTEKRYSKIGPTGGKGVPYKSNSATVSSRRAKAPTVVVCICWMPGENSSRSSQYSPSHFQ